MMTLLYADREVNIAQRPAVVRIRSHDAQWESSQDPRARAVIKGTRQAVLRRVYQDILENDMDV